ERELVEVAREQAARTGGPRQHEVDQDDVPARLAVEQEAAGVVGDQMGARIPDDVAVVGGEERCGVERLGDQLDAGALAPGRGEGGAEGVARTDAEMQKASWVAVQEQWQQGLAALEEEPVASAERVLAVDAKAAIAPSIGGDEHGRGRTVVRIQD